MADLVDAVLLHGQERAAASAQKALRRAAADEMERLGLDEWTHRGVRLRLIPGVVTRVSYVRVTLPKTPPAQMDLDLPPSRKVIRLDERRPGRKVAGQKA